MFKMGLHDPFEYLKHKLWPKKGQKLNCQFDSRSWKVKNRLDFFSCKWCATCCWKVLDEGYNFALHLISIGGLHTNLWDSKITGTPILRISGHPLGTRWHLVVGLVAKHKKYYKGEGVDFPQVRAVVSFVNPRLPVVRPCTKSAPTMH
jgi:hypothetical protein